MIGCMQMKKKPDELQPQEPKFVQRLFDYAEKIEEASTKNKRESMKLPDGSDWAGHLFGNRYSLHGSSSQAYTANLDLQLSGENLPRRSSTLRSRGGSNSNNDKSTLPSTS